MSNTFNPREHLITIRTKQGPSDYLPVKWRLVWFRQECPNGSVETEMLHLDVDRETEEEALVWNAEKRRSDKVMKTGKGMAIFRAVVKDGNGGISTSTKMETAASFSDYLEKAETGAIGRALAALGYGTQFTADELDEANRLADSPVERNNNAASSNGNSTNNHAVLAEIKAEWMEAFGIDPQLKDLEQRWTSWLVSVCNGPVPALVSAKLLEKMRNVLAQRKSQHPVAANNVSSNEPAEANVTEQQLASIHKLCQFLNKSEPADATSLSFLGAKRVIQQLTAEYKELKQQNSKAS